MEEYVIYLEEENRFITIPDGDSITKEQLVELLKRKEEKDYGQ